jgi:hypothetical protein
VVGGPERAAMIGTRTGVWFGLGLTLWLAVPPATGMPPRCREVPAADARLRLEVWGRELAGAKGPVTAHSTRRVARVADRGGTVLEALVLVALAEARGPSGRGTAATEPVGGLSRRPRWVLCAGEGSERPRGG